ncbi:hypothetical protein H9P43_005368 [Blastocladiella emersonii ATCC 22665]|nr:hypothetical protein H9P43_005368 [Blastocladiella emersonii ATCC 22665]
MDSNAQKPPLQSPSTATVSSNAAADDAPATLTASDLLQREAALEADAARLLQYKSDACSYARGYINQSVYVCLTCTPADSGVEPAGICYACHIQCHGDHEIAELFTKRAFRCDCGTARFARDGCGGGGCGGGGCTLEEKPQGAVNEENTYGHNFRQRYCVCDAVYDPRVEKREMVQCIACQDWFHDACIPNLPDGDAYDDLICGPCTGKLGLAVLHELSADRPIDIVAPAATEASSAPSSTEPAPKATVAVPAAAATPSNDDNTRKRPHSPEPDAPRPTASKRQRVAVCISSTAPPAADTAPWLFLVDGWRDQVCRCGGCKHRAETLPLPFLYAEEPVITPDVDPDAGKPLYEAGVEMLQRVDRVRAIEGIQAMDDLSSRLKSYFKDFAESGRVVSAEDIQAFFETMKKRGGGS